MTLVEQSFLETGFRKGTVQPHPSSHNSESAERINPGFRDVIRREAEDKSSILYQAYTYTGKKKCADVLALEKYLEKRVWKNGFL